MNVKERYKQIKKLESHLNETIKVIEIIDPIRNDTDSNDYISKDGVEMVTIPRFRAWITKGRNKLKLKVIRVGHLSHVELDLLSGEVIDSISKVLCEKRDWYRKKIESINNGK